MLELHNQLFVEYKSNPGYFIVELRTSTHTLDERDAGYAELLYMWLHTPLPSAMHNGVHGMDGMEGMEGLDGKCAWHSPIPRCAFLSPACH